MGSSCEEASFHWTHQDKQGMDHGASVPSKSHLPLPVTGVGSCLAFEVITELNSYLMRPEGLGPQPLI